MSTREHLSKHDREIADIRTLVKTGMRLMVQIHEEQCAFRKDIRELAAAQKHTDAALRSFIERTGTRNGHSKRRVDLQ